MPENRTRMIALYGKGGIGKSTVASNLSAVFARRGMKVLHVGCDPKHDSTMALLDGLPVKTVIQQISGRIKEPSDILLPGKFGMHCIECGGPEPGVGCGGRGVSRMFEVLDDLDLVKQGQYDIAVFDVLGDVVCGGFAAPLKQGRADLVYIVVSEGVMALFAANNIARALKRFASNGIALGGLVVNLCDETTNRPGMERFATALGTRIVAWLPRDPIVRRAEVLKKTTLEMAPDSAVSRVFDALAGAILADSAADHSIPTPIDEARFDEFILDTFGQDGV
jgi:nitrogenase iron protein NifH